jgi:hypothetical protein
MSRDNRANQPPTRAAAQKALPGVLQQARDHVLTVLQTHVERAAANCNDALYATSIKARSNSEQTAYFEAMREIRSRTDAICADFRQQLSLRFEELLPGNYRPTSSSPETRESFSLVADDEIEQDVALSSMVSKARAKNQEPLYHLKCRFDKLLPGADVVDGNNPLDPEALCKSIKTATAPLELNIKARIILLKQFDRDVLGKLPEILADANEFLISRGVLPEIKSTIKKHASVDRPRQAANIETAEAARDEPAPAAESAPGQYGLSDLSLLLSSLRRLNVQPPSFIPRYSSRSGPVVSQDELVRLLAELQASISYEEILHQQALDIRSAIENIMASMDAKDSTDHALETPDEDVINLVAMFFDFALSDPSLSMAFQALIARLQLPVLKLALRDPDFFNSNRHPARMLINEIARLGVGFDDSSLDERDLLVKTLEEIIETIHDNPHADKTLFEAMRKKLQQAATEEEKKALRVEKRAREMASGQAKSQAARSKVQTELRQRLKDALLPEAISSFLIKDWQKVLMMTYLNQGESSAEWLEALQSVDDLIWSVRQHEDEKSRARRIKLLPALRSNLRRGLAKIVINENERESILKVVDEIHDALTRGQLSAVQYDPLRPEQQAELIEAQEQKNWKDMTALERQQAKHQRITYDYIRRADALLPGTWMVFEHAVTGKRQRCKLAAVLKETDSYIFVNRFGFKVLEKKRKEVAQDMQSSKAHVLDSSPIFDRAFNKIAGSLKDLGPVAAN